MSDAPPQPQDPNAPPALSNVEGPAPQPWGPTQTPYSMPPQGNRFSPPPPGYGPPPASYGAPPPPYYSQYAPQTRMPAPRGNGAAPPYGAMNPPPYGPQYPPGNLPAPYGRPGYGYFPPQPKRTSPVVWIGVTILVLSLIGAAARSVKHFDRPANPGYAPETPAPPQPPQLDSREFSRNLPPSRTLAEETPRAEWRLYTSKPGDYAVEFPSQPKLKDEAVKIAGGSMVIYTASYSGPEGYFESSFYNEKPLAADGVDSYLRASVKSIEQYCIATMRRETLFDQGKFRGIDFELTLNNGGNPVFARVMYASARVYTLIVNTGHDRFHPHCTRFLDSFKTLPKSPGVTEPRAATPSPGSKTAARPRVEPGQPGKAPVAPANDDKSTTPEAK